MVSLRRLEAGEEVGAEHYREMLTPLLLSISPQVLTDYKYSYSKAPRWYKEELSSFLVNNCNMAAADIQEYINKMEAKKNSLCGC